DNLYVAGVQFLLDGQPIGPAVLFGPYSTAWDSRTVANGSHVLSARAWDVAGNSSFTNGVTVVVGNAADTTPPAVQVTSPSNGSAASGPLVLNAVASDNIGVASVQFRLNGVNIGSPDTTAPYRVVWDPHTVSDGVYSLVAVATDVSGTTS